VFAVCFSLINIVTERVTGNSRKKLIILKIKIIINNIIIKILFKAGVIEK
jgi:hypothetical protein